jgi:wyosine [tRNA(Phe)-imidazoG37] synthetase (radical SAM superfamily)
MKSIQKNINTVIVSLDAGTSDTYARVRRGGDWNQLMDNMKFLSELNRDKKIGGLRIDFVVQTSNYREMSLVVELGKQLKVDTVYFSSVINWGTWNDVDFDAHAVWKDTHPLFDDFIQSLRSPIFDDSIVDLGNITQYRNGEVLV